MVEVPIFWDNFGKTMDLGSVTLTQMRYAVAVSETQNFRLAAARAGVSQSGLSMQLQKLEDLLGVILFDRSKQPVLVTPEGSLALRQMRAILRETERLGQIVREEEEPSGPYRLGVIPTLSATVIPLFLDSFLLNHPRVELRIEELKTSEMMERLESDTLDAGIAATPLATPGLNERRVGLERMLAYLPPGDPLLRKSRVPQEGLKKRNLWVMPEGHCFRAQVLSLCDTSTQSSPGQVHFESGSFETLIRLVDKGMGATVLPELVAERLPAERQQAQLRPFTSPEPVREIGLVTARSQLRKRVSEALVDALRGALGKALRSAPRSAQVLSPLPERGGSPKSSAPNTSST